MAKHTTMTASMRDGTTSSSSFHSGMSCLGAGWAEGLRAQAGLTGEVRRLKWRKADSLMPHPVAAAASWGGGCFSLGHPCVQGRRRIQGARAHQGDRRQRCRRVRAHFREHGADGHALHGEWTGAAQGRDAARFGTTRTGRAGAHQRTLGHVIVGRQRHGKTCRSGRARRCKIRAFNRQFDHFGNDSRGDTAPVVIPWRTCTASPRAPGRSFGPVPGLSRDRGVLRATELKKTKCAL